MTTSTIDARDVCDATAAARVAMLFASPKTEAAIADGLRHAGMSVQGFSDVLGLATAAKSHAIDVALVEDEGLFLVSCLAVLRMRGMTTLPVIAVGRGSTEQFASALRRGAVDYVMHGESMDAIVNRVGARLQLSRCPDTADFIEVAGCVLDEPSHTLRGASGEHALTGREFALAWVLFEHAGRVVGTQTLAHQVWGRDTSVAKRTIEQHVWRLRRKLLEVSRGSVAALELQAVHSVGYRLSPEAQG